MQQRITDAIATVRRSVESPLISKADAAAYLQVCARTVDNFTRDGTLAYIKLGRRVLFRKSDLDALIASSAQRSA